MVAAIHDVDQPIVRHARIAITNSRTSSLVELERFVRQDPRFLAPVANNSGLLTPAGLPQASIPHQLATRDATKQPPIYSPRRPSSRLLNRRVVATMFQVEELSSASAHVAHVERPRLMRRVQRNVFHRNSLRNVPSMMLELRKPKT